MSSLLVSVGIIANPLGQYLVSKRTPTQASPNQWEFPGGKLEDQEEPEAALSREMSEELGIEVDDAQYLGFVTYQGSLSSIGMYVYMIRSYTGNPSGQEGQSIRWLYPHEFKHFDFLASTDQLLNLVLEKT